VSRDANKKKQYLFSKRNKTPTERERERERESHRLKSFFSVWIRGTQIQVDHSKDGYEVRIHRAQSLGGRKEEEKSAQLCSKINIPRLDKPAHHLCLSTMPWRNAIRDQLQAPAALPP